MDKLLWITPQGETTEVISHDAFAMEKLGEADPDKARNRLLDAGWIRVSDGDIELKRLGEREKMLLRKVLTDVGPGVKMMVIDRKQRQRMLPFGEIVGDA